jgi:hypothetical protein
MRKRIKRLWHLLFECPTFWSFTPKFTCPVCHKQYRCYWDGNDIAGMIDVCNKCAVSIDAEVKYWVKIY